MVLCTLKVRDFRAHAESALELAPNVNLFLGPNGAGKTNVLEAVHYLCLSKSFLTSVDRHVLRDKAENLQIDGEFSGKTRTRLTVRMVYVPHMGKRMFVNGVPLERMVDIVGMFPVVVFEPGTQALTTGGPAARRRFLDNILSQARPAYMENLITYRRALRQRNELLSRNRGSHLNPALLAPLDLVLANAGSRIIAVRLAFLTEFKTYLNKAWELLGSQFEEPTLVYRGLAAKEESPTPETIRQTFLERLERARARELMTGRTATGPQRDELTFNLDGRDVRRFASAGQHRTFGIALKLAQYFYLDDRLEEAPILLLDDIFDSLDERRIQAIVELLLGSATGQSLVTTALAGRLDGYITGPGNKCFYVEAGSIKPAYPSPQAESE